MKKNIIRTSMLTVAALSLLLGGTAAPTSVKEQVSTTPAIISKAIENDVAAEDKLEKGTPLKSLAQDTEDNTEVTQIASEDIQNNDLEVKPAKVESNQVVANIDSYLNIRTEANEESEVVGKFYNGNVGTIVEKGDEWSLVSSGNAYGYVKNDYLLFGSDAESYIEDNCDQIVKVTAETVNVRAEDSTESEVLSQKDEGDALTILGKENGWYKVAVTDEQSGYISSDFVYVDYVYETAVTIEEERAAEEAAAAALAEQQAVENQTSESESQTTETAQTETIQSQADESQSTQAATTEEKKTETKTESKKETVESTDIVVTKETTSTETVKQESSSTSGQAVADYAVQFVGNPYVYGGTSLTNGADCSGFVQSVYAHFGYSLSRTAASQAGDGVAVSLDNLQPGDLIFYHGYGHVAIYIGGGQVVHASNPSSGIKISAYNYSSIDSACRIIK